VRTLLAHVCKLVQAENGARVFAIQVSHLVKIGLECIDDEITSHRKIRYLEVLVLHVIFAWVFVLLLKEVDKF